MKKLNQKGITIVEVSVTFVLVMIIVVGLLKIAMSYRGRAQLEMTRNELLTFKSTVTKTVMDDIQQLGLQSISACTGQCVELRFSDGTIKKLQVGSVNPTNYNSVKYKYIQYGQFKHRLVDMLPKTIPDGELPIDYQSIYIPVEPLLKVTVVGSRTIYSINIPIEHVDLMDDYGIHITTTVG